MQREQEAKRQLTQYSYDDRVYLSQREWDAGRVEHARELLQEAGDLAEELTPGRKPWEWYYLHRVFHPELAVLQGHAGPVRPASFHPDGLEGLTGRVLSVSFSPDGRRLASASDDGPGRLWDAETGKPLAVLQGQAGMVVSVSFSPDGRRVATAGNDGTVRLWDAETGKPLAVLRGQAGVVVCVAFSPDGRRVATTSASGDWTASLWDTESGKPPAVLRGHTQPVWSVAFSPDGRRLATASHDKTARLWDAESGQPLAVLQGHTSALFGPWPSAPTADASPQPAGTTRRGCGTPNRESPSPSSKGTPTG